MSKENLELTLEQACRGLIFISEIDADVVPIFGSECDEITAQVALKMARRDTSTHIEERRVEDFFRRLTEKKMARRHSKRKGEEIP